MSEQKENAQLEAYRKLVEDFKRFVSSEIRTEENSYRIVDMTSEDAEINDPSVPVTQLEDDKAEKLAGICMDLSMPRCGSTTTVTNLQTSSSCP